MKIKPQIYAQTLVDSASSENLKQISRNFWHILQKNKQYRDLNKVLDAVDIEATRRDGKILAKIYAKNELTEYEQQTIMEKLQKKV